MKKKIKMLLAMCMCILLLASGGCAKQFDAVSYVRGVLDVTFQDETVQAVKIMKDVSEYDLHVQHDESITRFVENNITSELEMSETEQAQFHNLCEKIFSVMKYHVESAEKTGRKEYEVSVTIQPSDVFVKFREALVKDSERMAAAIEAGEYTGTDEEISQKILADIIYNAYDLLSISYLDMEYGKEQTVIIKVKADSGNEYAIDEEDVDNLIIKILRLDEIQD